MKKMHRRSKATNEQREAETFCRNVDGLLHHKLGKAEFADEVSGMAHVLADGSATCRKLIDTSRKEMGDEFSGFGILALGIRIGLGLATAVLDEVDPDGEMVDRIEKAAAE